MAEWEKVRVGDFLTRVKYPIALEADSEYQLVTVRMHHKGIVPREKKLGKKIGSKMYQVKAGQFILSGIDARNGAFGIIPQDLDGAIVTNDFWYFELNEAVVKRDFFYWLTSTPLFLDACIKSSEGTTNRRRLQRNRFFDFEFHIPEIEQQIEILREIEQKQAFQESISIEITAQQNLTQQLRQAILQEAVQGKLTEAWRQAHPDVEPASELLKRIQAEKAQLVKEGKIKKQKPLPPISGEEIPFELPEGWKWCRLGEITTLITKGSSPKWQGVKYITDSQDGILFITSKNVGSYDLVTDELTYVEKKFNDIEPRSILKKGDLLTNIVGASIGRTAIYELDRIANINQAVCLIRVEYEQISKRFLLYYLNSTFIITLMFSKQFAPGRANLSMTNVANFLIPLPSFTEQNAIVTKIDRLMAYCNQLEQQITQSQTTAEQLMQTVLREAFTASS